MRRALLLSTLLTAVVAPAASACTLDNCYENRFANGTRSGLTATCVLTGRSAHGFAIAAEAHSTAQPAAITVRCRAYSRGTLVYDRSAPAAGPATAFADRFTAGPDIRICVDATAGSTTVSDCS